MFNSTLLWLTAYCERTFALKEEEKNVREDALNLIYHPSPNAVMSLHVHFVKACLLVWHFLTGVRHLQHDASFNLEHAKLREIAVQSVVYNTIFNLVGLRSWRGTEINWTLQWRLDRKVQNTDNAWKRKQKDRMEIVKIRKGQENNFKIATNFDINPPPPVY